MAKSSEGRVLLADDEVIIRKGMRSILEELNFEVVGEATDGYEAVEQVVALFPDVVFMDIKMPRMDGIEATRRIMRIHPVPVIVLTAYSDRRLVEEASDAGVLAYLMKPVHEAEILPAVAVARARFADLRWLSRSSVDPVGPERSDAVRRVETATQILSTRYQISTTQAAARLRRLAQKTNREIVDVADAILDLEQE